MKPTLFHHPSPRAARLFLTMILGIAAFLRLWDFENRLGFGIDQGYFYLVIMEWFYHGHWPLLGHWRAVGDHAIGPGWYYLIAPGLIIGDFHPAAGMIVMILIGLATLCLVYLWLEETSRSQVAALGVVLIMTLSRHTIIRDQTLWNPNALPFFTILTAWAISKIESGSSRWLTAWAISVLFLPHIHTTGWIIVAVSLPFTAWACWQGGANIRLSWRGVITSREVWVILLIALALYLPPLYYEFQSGPGNLLPYVRNTFLSTAQSDFPLTTRLFFISNLFSYLPLRQAFDWPLRDIDLWRWGLVLWVMVLILVLLTRIRPVQISVIFLAAAYLSFWAVAIRQGEFFDPYYISAVVDIPLLLTGWAAGRLLTSPQSGSYPLRLLGAGLLVFLLALSFVQLPKAFAGEKSTPTHYQLSRLIVNRTITELRRHKFEDYSLALVEGPNYRAYLQAMLWRKGYCPANRDFERRDIRTDEFGQALVLVLRGEGREYRGFFEGFVRNPDAPMRAADALIYWLPVDLLPTDAQSVNIEVDTLHRQYRLNVIQAEKTYE